MATEQELFWKGEFGAGYMERNSDFDYAVAQNGWKKMLANAQGVNSILECGSNIGRNLRALKALRPGNELSLIEINPKAFETAVSAINPKYKFNGAITESSFAPHSFDLTFICGVLIHIAPEHLLANMAKLYEYSSKYVLICEYFSRTPVVVEYHGNQNKLFKRDFGKYFLENFKVKVVDYGFLWSHEYEPGGFDDMTWWLFEKI